MYVLDPDIAENEHNLRFHNMSLPANTPAAEQQMLIQLLHVVQIELRRSNPYIHDFLSAAEIIATQNSPSLRLVIDEEKRPEGEHARRFNKGFKEISVIMDDEHPGNRSFVVSLRGPGRAVREMQDTHRSADPLHYTLLFPYGNDGWHPGLTISPLQYYCYHIQVRLDEGHINSQPSSIHYAGRLFQEFLCTSYAKVENQRLKYIKYNQKELRGETYKRLCEDVHAHANNNTGQGIRSGQQIILPGSFTGSPRFYHAHFQDAMAIVRVYHKPDFFITFTCNPQWPEIQQSLLRGQQAHDRPDIVARVFKQKIDQFVRDFQVDSVLGNMAAFMCVIEFQKRGLPHAHILFIAHQTDRLHTAEDVDNVISAELPPDPMSYPEGPLREQAKRLEQLVLQNMVHSCSPICKKEGDCSKYFPKSFSSTTEWDENAFYPRYRRRSPEDGGRSVVFKGKMIDNSRIVPYCPYMMLRYEAHINLEACVSPTAAKYLFKYVTKGPDRTMATIGYDEVEHFQNYRSIGASEACWRLLQFEITDRHPAVTTLRIHLPGEEYVVFEEGTEEAAASKPLKATELTAFFSYNTTNPETSTTYVDFPTKYVFNGKQWKPRQRNFQGVIGRIHTVHPLSGDTFYLRILLHHDHCKGVTSFDSLLTVNGRLHESYKEVCSSLGLLQDDNEWNSALEEAAMTKMPAAIRSLYVVILLYCQPSNPRQLFDTHLPQWLDDFRRKYPDASDQQYTECVLQDLQQKLQFAGFELHSFNLPPSQPHLLQQLEVSNESSGSSDESRRSVILQEELAFDLDATRDFASTRISMLTPSQSCLFQEITQAVERREGGLYFVDARGGTGKTFTLNTLLAAERTREDKKNICLAVATSGIAATLLSLGRTFHSRFKVPLFADKDSNVSFNIKPTDTLAKVIIDATMIVWDEAPMGHRHLLEGLDRLLRDLMLNQRPFGGKLVILCGDFRQVLPVVPHGSRSQITAASFKRSPLWKHFQVRHLTENMRIGSNPTLKQFDDWLLNLGNGELPIMEKPDKIEIPNSLLFPIDDTSLETSKISLIQFIECIFPDMNAKLAGPPQHWIEWIAERAILAPKNSTVDSISSLISEQFPGEAHILYSADSTNDPDDATRFPVEYLNSLTPAGLPPYRLFLKNDMILMLLRNLNPREGLCNGTRLILKTSTSCLLHCKIASGDHQGKDVLIPRIELSAKDGDFPFAWRRRQFPVRAAFAMTINKSQGQTLKQVGVWLDDPTFTHGQLYVAASRVGHPAHLHIAVKTSHQALTRNVVFKEVL